MNKITTLSAIAMFAVIMGMSAFAPAMAAPNNDKSSATTAVCHFFEVEDDLTTTEIDESLDSAWGVLFTNSNGATNGHAEHGDDVIDGETIEEFTAACDAKNQV